MRVHLQRVAAIHDLSGFGRSSLMVVIPVLSSMGVQVCPLPTAVLSSNTAFEGCFFRDMTLEMPRIIDHWKRLDIFFDAIYSGYLGSADQVDLVKRFIHDFKRDEQLVVVDPVLGDDGRLYVGFDDKMVMKMKELVAHAEVITPNLTEAALLLDEDYDPNINIGRIKEWAWRLADMGPDKVIITSVHDNDRKNHSSVIAYNSDDERFWRAGCDYFPANYPGTGDAFTSVLAGSLLQGDSLPIALDRAVHFISLAVRATFGHDHNPAEGILLEKVLPSLNAPVQISSYRLLEE